MTLSYNEVQLSEGSVKKLRSKKRKAGSAKPSIAVAEDKTLQQEDSDACDWKTNSSSQTSKPPVDSESAAADAADASSDIDIPKTSASSSTGSGGDTRKANSRSRRRRGRLYNIENGSIPESRDIYFFCHRSGVPGAKASGGSEIKDAGTT